MKITLKTLPEATAQQVFDQVAKHLLTQNKKAEAPTISGNKRCVYRSYDGLACAAGYLISDEEYAEKNDSSIDEGNKFEESGEWSSLISDGLVPADHCDLIARLQACHDRNDTCMWKRRLSEIANELNLSTSILDEFTS